MNGVYLNLTQTKIEEFAKVMIKLILCWWLLRFRNASNNPVYIQNLKKNFFKKKKNAYFWGIKLEVEQKIALKHNFLPQTSSVRTGRQKQNKKWDYKY